MISLVLVLVFSYLVGQQLINFLAKQVKNINKKFLNQLFWYHLFLALVYYIYAVFNASDSKNYYNSILDNADLDWFNLYGTSTIFIKFIGFPFVNFFGFSFEAMMVLFAFFGFIGVAFFYALFEEKFPIKIKTINNWDLKKVIFLLPNLHFWTGSFGKGSIIFMGIAMVFYAVIRFRERLILLFLGGIIVYHVRPHIMLMLMIAIMIGVLFSSRGISNQAKTFLLIIGFASISFVLNDALKLAGIEQEEFISEGVDLSHRASELGKATSGVDINNYNLFEKFFTFFYRPLFVDAPGILGIIVSIENLFYVLITIRLLNLRFLRYLFQSQYLVKASLLFFIVASLALAQVSGNLGIAIRQKSQVILCFFFVVMSYRSSLMVNKRR